MRKKNRELSFFFVWIVSPLAILFYQNCTPANFRVAEVKITPVTEKSAQNLNLQH